MNELSEYKTFDLAMAAFLKLNGYTVTKVEKKDGRTAEFYFENVDRDKIREYNNGLGTVEPKDFATMMRQFNQTAKRVIRES